MCMETKWFFTMSKNSYFKKERMMYNYFLKLYLFCFNHLSCSKLHHRLKMRMTLNIPKHVLLNIKQIHFKNSFARKKYDNFFIV